MTLPDPFKLSGKRILVTGASSGIGRACCLQIAAQGGHVVALGRDVARLDETLRLCSDLDHLSVAVDITDDLGIETAVKEMPNLNGVVHAAGRCLLNPVRFLKKKEFSSLMDANAIAAFALTARLLKTKLLGEESSLVFITSVSGLVGEAGMMEYSATKGAVLSGARSLALELARQKIRVNCVAPGSVRTPMLEALEQRMTENAIHENTQSHPLGIGSPEDVAFAVNYLLAPASRWVTGTTLVVDGGYSAQ